jgi:hypothetical protein
VPDIAVQYIIHGFSFVWRLPQWGHFGSNPKNLNIGIIAENQRPHFLQIYWALLPGIGG